MVERDWEGVQQEGGAVPLFEDGSTGGRCQMSEKLVCYPISKALIRTVLELPPQATTK